MNSVKAIRNHLELRADGFRVDDVSGSIAAHVMELHRRVRRLKHHDAGIEVRISPAVQALALTSEAGQEARG